MYVRCAPCMDRFFERAARSLSIDWKALADRALFARGKSCERSSLLCYSSPQAQQYSSIELGRPDQKPNCDRLGRSGTKWFGDIPL